MTSRRFLAGAWLGIAPGQGGAAGSPAACAVCGVIWGSSGMGSGGGLPRRRSSLRSGAAAAAAIGDLRGEAKRKPTRRGFLSSDEPGPHQGPWAQHDMSPAHETCLGFKTHMDRYAAI